jgi:DNA adenine methylase
MSRYSTPLRYPGGKQKLTPFILEVLEANELLGGEYAEPYCGGAGVAIELLLRKKVARIHLNDASRAVFAFWKAVLEQTEALCRRIGSAALTVPEWRRQREILNRPTEFDILDLGFSLLYLNRCNRSGIPNGGLIGGLSQTGEWNMDARFNRSELIRRVEAIAHRQNCIMLRNTDAERFIGTYLHALPQRTLVYCDPPYYNKANRLYLNHYAPNDHARIARTIQSEIALPWLVSYDCAPEVLEHYSARRSFVYELQYNAAAAYKGREVFFFADELNIPAKSAVPAIDKVLRGS